MVIALLTDFGTRDHFVASMKGTILSIAPTATIVDVTHEIEPYNILAAAFTLGSCWKDFPEGTVFVAVVDPGVGSSRRPVAVRAGGRTFVCPDNGILSFVLEGGTAYDAFELTNRDLQSERVSATFHGRDIFAPAAGHLANGVEIEKFGPPATHLEMLESTIPTLNWTELTGSVIHIDRFGNLITNLRAGDIPATFEMKINGRTITRLRRFYAEAGDKEIFAIVGSTGRVEISVNKASARDVLEARVGDAVTVESVPAGR